MGRSLLALCALALLGAGCFDEIPDPTQGFVEISTGGVPGVEVFADDVSQGVVTTVGPLDAGPHVIRVRRAGYEVVPATRTVDVRPGRTVRAEFALTLAFTGSARVTATDELRGTEVTGAEILADVGAGLAATGVTTPGAVRGLPPGPVRFAVRGERGTGSPAVTAEIVVAETTAVATVLAPPRAVLAEMFTYSICPNCPEAAAHLEGIHDANPHRVYVIEWHSLERVGSILLPLFDPRWRERERYYTGGVIVGWPAVAIQGGASDVPPLIVGADAAAFALYESRIAAQLAACGPDCPVVLGVDGTIGPASAGVTVRARWRGGSIPGDLKLRVVLIENDLTGVAPANTPRFTFVAREIREEPIAFGAPGAILVRPATLPVSVGWVVDHLDVVAFVQSDATREILAVGGLR